MSCGDVCIHHKEPSLMQKCIFFTLNTGCLHFQVKDLLSATSIGNPYSFSLFDQLLIMNFCKVLCCHIILVVPIFTTYVTRLPNMLAHPVLLFVLDFIALLDNYTAETGEQEVVTKEEFKENVR